MFQKTSDAGYPAGGEGTPKFYRRDNYRPQRSCGQGNVFTGVCLSTGGEGVCLSACWDARPPRTRQPPPPGSGRPPWDQADPPGTRQTPLGPGRPPWIRQIPPDQAGPPWDQVDPPPPGTRQTPPGSGRRPPGSRLQHTVYERPVRILLECILVIPYFCQILLPARKRYAIGKIMLCNTLQEEHSAPTGP